MPQPSTKQPCGTVGILLITVFAKYFPWHFFHPPCKNACGTLRDMYSGISSQYNTSLHLPYIPLPLLSPLISTPSGPRCMCVSMTCMCMCVLMKFINYYFSFERQVIHYTNKWTLIRRRPDKFSTQLRG